LQIAYLGYQFQTSLGFLKCPNVDKGQDLLGEVGDNHLTLG
jgi:hypothetical protein